MALHDNPPHRATLHSVATTRDSGGGVTLTYTAAQSAIPCSIDTASASEVERFAQMQIQITHRVAVLSSKLTTTLTRGMKLVTDDTSDSYHVEGFSKGRAYGGIPAFTYIYCRQLA